MRKFVCGLLVGICGTLIVASVIVGFGWTPVMAASDPPHWESVLGRRALDSATARQAPKLQNPAPPTNSCARLDSGHAEIIQPGHFPTRNDRLACDESLTTSRLIVI
jgi:hypothetical protein